MIADCFQANVGLGSVQLLSSASASLAAGGGYFSGARDYIQ